MISDIEIINKKNNKSLFEQILIISSKSMKQGKEKYGMRFIFEDNKFYIGTDENFWKVVFNDETRMFTLYHRNTYNSEMSDEEAINGAYHLQGGLGSVLSVGKVIFYVGEHDKAVKVIRNDYRKLPKNTRREKLLYRSVKKREERRWRRRVEEIFEELDRQKNLKEFEA